jgi:hypothetical protein
MNVVFEHEDFLVVSRNERFEVWRKSHDRDGKPSHTGNTYDSFNEARDHARAVTDVMET